MKESTDEYEQAHGPIEVDPHELIYGPSRESVSVIESLPKLNILSYGWFAFIMSAIRSPRTFLKCRRIALYSHINAVCTLSEMLLHSIQREHPSPAVAQELQDFIRVSPQIYPLKSRVLLSLKAHYTARTVFYSFYQPRIEQNLEFLIRKSRQQRLPEKELFLNSIKDKVGAM